MKNAYIYVNYDNIVVLNVYLKIIKGGLERAGYKCSYIKNLKGVAKKDFVVFSTAKDAFIYYLRGYRNLLLWQQGLQGEESYMRNHSSARKAILNYMDRFTVKKAKVVFFVSECMKQYYEALVHKDLSNKCYIMPCFNERFDEKILIQKDYSKKIFAYVGSLSVWQCFNETVELYLKIEESIKGAFFKVLTFDVEQAEKILQEKKVKNYIVKRVPQEQVKAELEDVVFGFMLRQNVIVNRVATPTKISSYLSAGVFPIYSPCLIDFHKQASGKNFAFPVNSDDGIQPLLDFINKDKNKDIIDKEIKELFATYYSETDHEERISALCKRCL